MATVITNLLSAIPIFGHDLVESNYAFIICLPLALALAPKGEKGEKGEKGDRREGLGFKQNLLPILPTVGTISPHAFKKGRKSRLDKKEYLSIPFPFIAFLVGFIDGDGYLQITRTTRGYIAIKLVIGLGLEDLSTLEFIKSVLKLGKITVNRDHINPNCRLIINKTDLQEVLFPLFIHYKVFFLTQSRKAQFDLAMYVIENDLKFYDDIPACGSFGAEGAGPNPLKAEKEIASSNIMNLPFFKNWLVGFTNAKGSFCIQQNKDACFQLKQRIHTELFEAFKLLFDTNRSISIENNRYAQFSVSSRLDLQKVVNFFSFSGLHPLIGLKSIQYLNWLTYLQNSTRYKNLHFPK